VRALAAAHAGRVRFHCWVQWLLDEQLARAARGVRLVQDLPIGVDPGGADAWIWQDVFAPGVSVGAPPDLFNRRGQDWGLPPLVPARLRAADYRPFIETVRASMRHGGGLRIDHVMGLFRLFWIPAGRPPAEGAYVRYPADDLLGIVALESQRAGAIVVGEDLGTVEEGTSERLRERGVLSCRVAWFGPETPAEFPELALGAITTHDLPTVAGVWSGADVARQRAVGLEPDASEALRDRLAAVAGVSAGAALADAVRGAHRALGASPSALVAATLEDALHVEERPNLPGTSTECPNWRLALPQPLEDICVDLRVQEVAAILSAARGARSARRAGLTTAARAHAPRRCVVVTPVPWHGPCSPRRWEAGSQASRGGSDDARTPARQGCAGHRRRHGHRRGDLPHVRARGRPGRRQRPARRSARRRGRGDRPRRRRGHGVRR
jgi:4-alpha-glucanotransferase